MLKSQSNWCLIGSKKDLQDKGQVSTVYLLTKTATPIKKKTK